MGYLDLHLHLVPAVDDGAVDVDESVEMARILVDHGWEGGAVTPHIRPGLFDNAPAPLRRAIETLAEALDAAGVPFAVRPGAEHYLDAEFLDRARAGDVLPLGGDGVFVLVEAPAAAPVPGLADLVFRLKVAGITPVFAHPERCAVFQDLAVARRTVEAGALLQLDLGSLDGAYGRPAKKAARRILAEGLYAVAGSDLHNADQAAHELGRWLTALERAGGTAARERLLAENPRRLLAGQVPRVDGID